MSNSTYSNSDDSHDILENGGSGNNGSKRKGRGFDKPKWGKLGKESIEFTKDGLCIVPKDAKLSRYLGSLARNYDLLPLSPKDWRSYDEPAMEKMWKIISDTIDWRVEDILHIPKIRYTLLKRLSKRIRNNKADLKRKYYTPYVGSPLRFTCGDDRVDSEQWRQMVNYWDNDPKNKIQVEKNIANRKNLKTSHTGGTKSFVRHQADFKERYGHEPDPIETYDLVHRRKDKDRSWVDGASEELGTKLTEELTQLAATHGEVTPKLRLQAYISVMGHETNGRVRGYGDLVTPNMVPWVQQTQHVSSICRSRKGRDYASLESKFLDLQDKYEKQSKKIDELTLMIQSSHRQSSNHVSEQTSSQHRSSSKHWSQESPTQITQHQPNTKQLMATQHQSSPEQNSPSQQNPQHIGTPVQYMPYPQLGPSHFPPSSQLYYPQACHPSLYPQTSYPYGEFTSMLRTDFMQHLMPPRNNQLDQRESSQRDILNS